MFELRRADLEKLQKDYDKSLTTVEELKEKLTKKEKRLREVENQMDEKETKLRVVEGSIDDYKSGYEKAIEELEILKSEKMSVSAAPVHQTSNPIKILDNVRVDNEKKDADMQTEDMGNQSMEDEFMSRKSVRRQILSDAGNEHHNNHFTSPILQTKQYYQRNSSAQRLSTEPSHHPFVFNSRNGSIERVNKLNNSNSVTQHNSSQLVITNTPLRNFLIEVNNTSTHLRNVMSKDGSSRLIMEPSQNSMILESRSKDKKLSPFINNSITKPPKPSKSPFDITNHKRFTSSDKYRNIISNNGTFETSTKLIRPPKSKGHDSFTSPFRNRGTPRHETQNSTKIEATHGRHSIEGRELKAVDLHNLTKKYDGMARKPRSPKLKQSLENKQYGELMISFKSKLDRQTRGKL